MKRSKQPEIKWPRSRSAAEVRRMSRKSQLRLARDLHACWAEKHRREMEWDLAWQEIYTRLLKE